MQNTEAEARAWLEAHADDPEVRGASLPVDHIRDPQTGETLGGKLTTTREPGREHRRPDSLTDRLLATLTHKSGGRSAEELDVRVRLDRALERLRPDQQDLLRRRYFEAQDLEDIAAELKRHHSSVQEKLQTAVQDLYVAIAETWALPYDPAVEHLGIRPGGRPARDRKGERRAAEQVFAAQKGVSDA